MCIHLQNNMRRKKTSHCVKDFFCARAPNLTNGNVASYVRISKILIVAQFRSFSCFFLYFVYLPYSLFWSKSRWLLHMMHKRGNYLLGCHFQSFSWLWNSIFCMDVGRYWKVGFVWNSCSVLFFLLVNSIKPLET